MCQGNLFRRSFSTKQPLEKDAGGAETHPSQASVFEDPRMDKRLLQTEWTADALGPRCGVWMCHWIHAEESQFVLSGMVRRQLTVGKNLLCRWRAQTKSSQFASEFKCYLTFSRKHG